MPPWRKRADSRRRCGPREPRSRRRQRSFAIAAATALAISIAAGESEWTHSVVATIFSVSPEASVTPPPPAMALA